MAGDYDGWSYSYGHTIGSAWGDLDNDGNLDLFVGNFSHPDAWQDRSKFYRNLGASGNYNFQDMSATVGLAWQESYGSPTLGDYDNDGDLDLYLTTVYGGDHPVLYRNNGNWTFTDVTASAGLANLGPTYQAAWADIDNDGDLDLVTDGRMWVNDANSNHWLKVKLTGDGRTVNGAAIGSEVRINVNGQTLTRQVEGGTGEGNQNDLTLHFGLGSHGGPVDLEIFAPGGGSTIIEGVAVDQTVVHDVTTPPSGGDYDGDGDVDGDDFLVWQNDFPIPSSVGKSYVEDFEGWAHGTNVWGQQVGSGPRFNSRGYNPAHENCTAHGP